MKETTIQDLADHRAAHYYPQGLNYIRCLARLRWEKNQHINDGLLNFVAFASRLYYTLNPPTRSCYSAARRGPNSSLGLFGFGFLAA